MLRCSQGGHGVGQVEVCCDAELTLTGGWVRGGRRAQLFFAALLFGCGQVAFNQGLQKLDNQLCIVRYLGLLQNDVVINTKVFHMKIYEENIYNIFNI